MKAINKWLHLHHDGRLGSAHSSGNIEAYLHIGGSSYATATASTLSEAIEKLDDQLASEAGSILGASDEGD